MRHLTRPLVSSFLVLIACGLPGTAQEWTRFRGPNGQGISDAKTIPVEWKNSDFNWKVDLPLGGHSSPVLWGEKIFLTCADDSKSAERQVVCLHADDGRILWAKKYSSTLHRKHPFNSFASATPAVDEERVYVAWSTPEEYTLLALDHSGKEMWRCKLGAFVSQHSCGTSPVVFEDLVIIGNEQDDVDKVDPNQKGDSSLVAVDRKTGEVRWKTPRRSDLVAYSTPCLYQPKGSAPQLIFNSKAHGVTGIDPHTGKVNWEISEVGSAPLLTKRSVSSPVLAGDFITATCGEGAGGNYLVAIRPGDPKAGREPQRAYRVEQKEGAPYVPTPIAKGNLLFLWGDSGIVSCLDSRSGKVNWNKRVSGASGANFFGSPICVNDKLYCVSAKGQVVVLAASAKYELLARNELNDICHSTPAVAGGRMYVRTYGHLFSVGGSKSGATR
jgi:outer membrane protein assembly factor BamB